MNKLDIIKQTRSISSNTLLETLKKLLQSDKKISEAYFRDQWLESLRRHPEIFSDGWYNPPPNGISVLFGTEDNTRRTSFKSLRPQEYWPSDEVFLNKDQGIAMFYASPVDKNSGMIGDFGLFIYFGKKPEIQNHFKQSYNSVIEIFNNIKSDMTLSDVSKLGQAILKSKGLYSDLVSPTDPTGTNIGHLIPFSNQEMTSKEKTLFENADKDWILYKDMLSKKRKFLNSTEQLKIKAPMAITIEPRPQNISDSQIPMTLFHTIALFKENGKKELLTDFEKFFKLAEMEYMF